MYPVYFLGGVFMIGGEGVSYVHLLRLHALFTQKPASFRHNSQRILIQKRAIGVS